MHLLIVESRFYPDLSDALYRGASRALVQGAHRASRLEVPGALEVAPAIAMARAEGIFDAFVALGVVIRGETYHFEVVAMQSARALSSLAVRHGLAIGNGILTVDSQEQAWERADPERGNKGGWAARAALALAEVPASLRSVRRSG